MSMSLSSLQPFLLPSVATLKGRMRTWRAPRSVFLAPEASSAMVALVPDHAQALLAWRDWAQAHVGERCTVGLSSRWLLHTLVPHTDGPRLTQAQALEAACQQWSHYMGLSGADLDAQWLLRPTAVPGGWLVAASPRALVADLLAVAKAHQVQVTWLGPWWAQGLQDWLQQSGADGDASHTLAMLEPAWTLSAQAQGGALQGLWAQPSLDTPASQRMLAPAALGALA
jgi:hypothetical protein